MSTSHSEAAATSKRVKRVAPEDNAVTDKLLNHFMASWVDTMYLSTSGHGGSHPNHIHNSSGVYNNNNNTYGSNNGVSTAIKKIARNHIGRELSTNGEGMESMSEDPLLRELMSDGGTHMMPH
jgi:hypothetical protein